TFLLWIPGAASLILFSDGLDQLFPSRQRRRWVVEGLHWLSASFVALALTVVLGAFVPSLFGLSASPRFWPALLCDALIGALAGFATFVLVASSGWAGEKLAYLLRRMGWIEDEEPKRSPVSFWADWSWRDGLRMVVLAIAGVLVSGGVTWLLAAAPSNTAAPAADTAPRLPSVWTSIVVPLAVWLLVTGLVWFAFDRVGSESRRLRALPQDARWRRRRATHGSALAVCLAIVVGWISAFALDGVIQDSLSAHGTVPAVSIQSVPPAGQVAYLAERFVPQFELASGEPWQPTTVGWYVAHSIKTSSRTFCGSSKTETQGCRELCDTETGGKCASRCDEPDPQACAPAGGNPDAVYYLYEDAANTPQDHPAQSGHDWAVIEYWIFYNYDSLHAGLVRQWHQSDWEQVSVLLDRTAVTVHPVEVAFSEHCYGAIRPAARVSWNGSHPVSFVGLGSHANYPTQNDLPIRNLQCLTRQTPRYLGAAGLFFNPVVAGWSLELPIAYLIGLRDETSRARPIAGVQPISQQSTPDIWLFHGYWGVDNNLRVEVGGLPIGAGPESPQDQNPSVYPFKDMFCNSSWLKLAATSTTAWVCPS
ncbi:MAG: hypothetical protein ACTHMY_06625, partial [Solirubrobacteraceae bacterium]